MQWLPRTLGRLALVAVALAASHAHATSMRAQNVIDLVELSERIMVGTVVDLRDGIDDRGLPFTEVTVEVSDSIRGANGSTYTFRQFGLLEPRTMPDGTQNLSVSPDGWPRFRADEEVMLFMYRPASSTGLQTTVGLLQGKFTVTDGTVVNALGNANVFHDVRIDTSRLTSKEQALVRQPDTMPVDAFVGLVRRAVEERWVEEGVIVREH